MKLSSTTKHTFGWQALAGFVYCAGALLCQGCGRTGPLMAEADGKVTYQGKPVPGATVVFITELGQPAMGQTDAEGKFTLLTQGQAGALVGPVRVSITAIHEKRPLTDQEMDQGKYIPPELLNSLRKNLIPTKYSNPDTSGLSATVSEDPEKNHFDFDL